MKDFLRVMLILLVICGFFALAIVGGFTDAKTASKHWNNGICEICGGAYKFSGGTHLRNRGDRYYYTCENCDHTIETYSIMK